MPISRTISVYLLASLPSVSKYTASLPYPFSISVQLYPHHHISQSTTPLCILNQRRQDTARLCIGAPNPQRNDGCTRARHELRLPCAPVTVPVLFPLTRHPNPHHPSPPSPCSSRCLQMALGQAAVTSLLETIIFRALYNTLYNIFHLWLGRSATTYVAFASVSCLLPLTFTNDATSKLDYKQGVSGLLP